MARANCLAGGVPGYELDEVGLECKNLVHAHRLADAAPVLVTVDVLEPKRGDCCAGRYRAVVEAADLDG